MVTEFDRAPRPQRETTLMKDDPEQKKKPMPPIPVWAWAFAVACGLIPVFTLGGAIPGAIGFGGAAGCVQVARQPTMGIATRLAICAVITVACWAAVAAIIGGFALLMK